MDVYDWFIKLPPGDKGVMIFYAFIAYGVATWILSRIFEVFAEDYYHWKTHRNLIKDREINARVDKYLADHAKRQEKERALSSTCAEHLALNQKVPGSNPGGLTIIGDRRFDVRRRITWYLHERTAIAMSDGDALPTKFQWRDLPRPEEVIPGHGVMMRTRDFKPEENKVQLLWDGMQTDEFKDEVRLKQFIIQLVYMIGNNELVPSELLADANLVYRDDWVDEWGCTDKNDDVIECPRILYRPAARKIQIMRGNLLPTSGPRFIPATRKPRIHAFVDRREIPAIIEIPDEKCFYSFRAGGFYEKDQKPLEDACEKGEKAV